MAKISLAGFKDPVRRPRYIIWTGVGVLVFAAFMITVLGVTSTRWFCSEGCHKVQDDTIVAYQHSSHSEISCMACHMPVNANPVIFLIHKAEALGELAQTVTNNYELPLNAESEVALTMKSIQCNQCHNIENRVVSPSPGIKIDHATHIDKAVECTICHNRIAHNEDFELQLKNPDGTPSKKHANFMSMTACFRCHGLEKGSPAPGECPACHTPGFELKPPSHLEADFFPKKHAELAKESFVEVEEALKESGDTSASPERKSEWMTNTDSKETLGQKLVPVNQIYYCGTCHREQFCNDCHGTPMPHSNEFIKPKDAKDPQGHPVISKQIPAKCVMCHTKEDPNFCNKCHHGEEVDYKYDPAQPWQTQHPKAVAKSGIKSCLTTCHTAAFCTACHTKNKVLPASHKAGTWLHGPTPPMTKYGSVPASASADHAIAALDSTETCGVCHGEGGADAPFCKACHKEQTPHTDQFKTTPGVHATEGRKNMAVCRNCHTWPELCSNCHHVGASTTQPWVKIHGSKVEAAGASTCAKCHADKKFCVDCHQRNQVKPASHNQAGFLKKASPNVGTHATLYQKDGTLCTYCHPGEAAKLPSSSFCMGCHKLTMPHSDTYGFKDPSAGPVGGNGGEHAEQLTSHKTNRVVCANCHAVADCNACHHKNGFVAGQSWMKTHPSVVKKDGATGCYDKKDGGTTGCHNEAFCSDCHVNRAAALKKAGL